MSIDRRELLRAVGVAGVGSVAGCGAFGASDTRGADGQSTDGPGLGTDGADAEGGQSSSGTGSATGDGEPTTGGIEPRGPGSASQLHPDEGAAAERFGAAVAISDDGQTALVGARGAEGPEDEGRIGLAAYVFERSGSGWEQRARFARDSESQGIRGHIVALSGDGTTAFISGYDSQLANATTVFAYERAGGEWRAAGQLDSPDVDEPIWFGRSVAASEDGQTVVVGAPYDPAPHGEESGSGFVFERSGDGWTRRAKLTAENGGSRDRLGRAVDVSDDGSVAVLGAWRNSDPGGAVSGAAHVFTAADDWSEEARVAAEDPASQDRFGWSVALTADGSALLVGAKGRDTGGPEREGTVYRFERAGGDWSQRQALTADPDHHLTHLGRGSGVSDDGAVALLGGSYETPSDSMGPYPRGALVVRRTEQGWEPQTTVATDEGVDGGAEEQPFAISGDGSTVLLGSSERDVEGRERSGAVYAFDI